jgi:hypothetical protein
VSLALHHLLHHFSTCHFVHHHPTCHLGSFLQVKKNETFVFPLGSPFFGLVSSQDQKKLLEKQFSFMDLQK